MKGYSLKKLLLAVISFAFLLYSYSSAFADLHKKSNIEGVCYWHGNPDAPFIALTFDDGPNDPYTSQILDILKKNNIKATFFMMGEYAEDNPELAKKVVAEGHIVGNHSYSHPDLRFKFRNGIRREITAGAETIEKATAVKPYLFRPPYGGRTGRMTDEAVKEGCVIIEYSVTASDGGKKIKAESIINNVLKRTRNGSIILFHDGDNYVKHSNRSETIKALPTIITILSRRGFKFVTVPELLDLKANHP